MKENGDLQYFVAWAQSLRTSRHCYVAYFTHVSFVKNRMCQPSCTWAAPCSLSRPVILLNSQHRCP